MQQTPEQRAQQNTGYNGIEIVSGVPPRVMLCNTRDTATREILRQAQYSTMCDPPDADIYYCIDA